MGCFNVACNLTQISMYSDDALWVPLISSNERGVLPQGDSFYIYPIAVFTPIAAPVFGNVDSYGRLENIERTPNVEAIEKFFKCGIDDLIDEPGSHPVPGLKGNKTLSGTFINRKAFEHFSVNLYDEFGGNIANLTTSDMTDSILNVCGFFDSGEKTKDERYNRVFKSERYPTVQWHSDGTWGRFSVNKNDCAYNPISFLEKLQGYTGIEPDPAVLKALQEGNPFKHSVQRSYEKLSLQRQSWARTKELMASLEKDEPGGLKDFDPAAYELSEFYRRVGRMGEGARWEATDIMRRIYGDDPAPYIDDFANLNLLSTALSVSNRFWSPQSNGYQHGSRYQELNLAKFVYDYHRKGIEEDNEETREMYKDDEDAEEMIADELRVIPQELIIQ